MQQVPLCLEGSRHSSFGFDPSAPVSRRLEFPTSDFESPSCQFPGAWQALFLSSSFSGMTRDPKLDEEVSSLYWLRITRFTGLAFAVGEPSFEVVFCPRFDMAPITMRSLSLESF